MTIALRLTKTETLYLSDALSYLDEGPTKERAPYPKLLLGLCRLIDEFEEHGGETHELPATTEELWRIRDVAKSAARVGNEPVGYTLLVKVARALLAAYAKEGL